MTLSTTSISVESLKLLAGHRDDLSNLTLDALPESIQAALTEARAEEAKNAARAAASQILAIMKSGDLRIQKSVEEIRSFRRAIDKAKAGINDIVQAREYALETNNWFPLLNKLGSLSISQLHDLSKDGIYFNVPKDWKLKTEKAGSTAKKVASPSK